MLTDTCHQRRLLDYEEMQTVIHEKENQVGGAQFGNSGQIPNLQRVFSFFFFF